MGEVSPDCSSSPVHHGEEQCLCGLTVQAQPGSRVGMDTEVGSVPGPSQEVASDDRPVCNLVKSPLFTLFLPFHDLRALGTDALLENWNGLQVYAVPP